MLEVEPQGIETAVSTSLNSPNYVIQGKPIYQQTSWKEGIIVYKHTSHPFNMKTWTSVGLLHIHLKWLLVE